MDSKDHYTPEEVAQIVMQYTQLASVERQIGGGRRIAMPGIKALGERSSKYSKDIPQNVGDLLRRKPAELEESILATVKASDD